MKHKIHKFKVGDRVKTINYGSGVGPEDMGKIVTIVECGDYGGHFGYKVTPAIGNSKTGMYDFMIGEESFEYVGPKIIKNWRDEFK